MYKSHLKSNFKSQLNQEQRMMIKVNKEFELRKGRLSNSNDGYRNKIKTIPDFEIEQYDCGDPLEVLFKKLTHVSYNVLQMCTEVFNGTPGNDIKDRIKRIASKLLLEYGDHFKELTDQMATMMNELSKHNIDIKLSPTFLTAILNVMNVINLKRDEETDDFMEEARGEEEKKISQEIVNLSKEKLGSRKQNAKIEEILPKKRSVLDYNSDDSEETMRSKIPMSLDIDHNNIMKLKQRILVWAEQQSGYNVNEVPVK